jgi:hypothetical protein
VCIVYVCVYVCVWGERLKTFSNSTSSNCLKRFIPGDQVFLVANEGHFIGKAILELESHSIPVYQPPVKGKFKRQEHLRRQFTC